MKSTNTEKRELSYEEEKKLYQLLGGDYSGLEEKANLLAETDDTDLADSIFEKIELDFREVYSNNQKLAIKFLYVLQDKNLIKKFEKYIVGVVSKSKYSSDISTLEIVFELCPKKLIAKVLAAIPVGETQRILDVLSNYTIRPHIDLALEQFSKPQYLGFLPLLVVLGAKYVSKEQSYKIIESITKEGLYGFGSLGCFSHSRCNVLREFAQKIVEIGWTAWESTSNYLSLDFLVMLLLTSKIKNKKILAQDNLKHSRKYLSVTDANKFLRASYLMGLEMDLQIKSDPIVFSGRIK